MQLHGYVIVGLAAIGLLCVGCENVPPTEGRKPQSRPATQAKPGGPSPEEGGATRPVQTSRVAESAAATQPATTESAPTQPAAAEPQPPEYITIVERFDPQRRALVEVQREDRNRLIIETRNVRRLRIDRERAELSLRRSVALQIDGQGIEWLPRSEVTEFERSPNGVWAPLKPAQSDKPRQP